MCALIMGQSPDIVVLCCGGNDLSDTNHPEILADNLLATASDIGIHAKAKIVIVCQILYRKQGRYIKTIEIERAFNVKVDKANAFLDVVSREHPRVKYWKHHGMKNRY